MIIKIKLYRVLTISNRLDYLSFNFSKKWLFTAKRNEILQTRDTKNSLIIYTFI